MEIEIKRPFRAAHPSGVTAISHKARGFSRDAKVCVSSVPAVSLLFQQLKVKLDYPQCFALIACSMMYGSSGCPINADTQR